MGTTSQAIVSASLDGKSIGIWDTRSGGESTAEISKYRPGGTKQQVVDAGRPDISDVTISRRWTVDRDVDIEKQLRNRVGVGVLTITEQPTDVDGIAFGKPRTWTGRVSSVTAGDVDSNSDDVRMITVTAVVWATA
ncbi:hypothetical protein N8K70_03940 [Microbacterium betulae]|uniref:Uncharacterized protein n=1 Tax=Microbacterium betulae TaxID=2981139 RepID=A0AA97FLX0_9MICO|nr:hypothetical protein [Microbacterium sp. AB]WOF23842.1 hypothetical protein N8K70_03940 [Microbacterium sp. AB]